MSTERLVSNQGHSESRQRTIRNQIDRLPLLHQEFHANDAVVADINMIYFSGEVDFGLAKGIVCWKDNVYVKGTA